MNDLFINVKENDWKKTIRICIVGIIKEEIDVFKEKYNLSIKTDKYIYWEGCYGQKTHIIIHCYQQNESGNISSSQLTAYVLEKKYDYYFYVGTAGAVEANLYDVVFANQVIYLQKGANISSGREYDGKALEITEKEKNLINTFLIYTKNKFDFPVYSAPIYSGDNVEKNPSVNELVEAKKFTRHLAAIDMESYGVTQALRFYESFEERNNAFITIIRGVSDRADTNKNATYEDGLSADVRKLKAMKNVQSILDEFIQFLYKFEYSK